MKKHIFTEEEINKLQNKPALVERLLEKTRKKGIQFPCPPGCSWLVLKHLFSKNLLNA